MWTTKSHEVNILLTFHYSKLVKEIESKHGYLDILVNSTLSPLP